MRRSILKILLLSLFIPVMVGCNKYDTPAPEGTLKVIFNSSIDLSYNKLIVGVYSLEDGTKSYIAEKNVPLNNEVDITLDIGNYAAQPYYTNTNAVDGQPFGSKSFQIRRGQTTVVYF